VNSVRYRKRRVFINAVGTVVINPEIQTKDSNAPCTYKAECIGSRARVCVSICVCVYVCMYF